MDFGMTFADVDNKIVAEGGDFGKIQVLLRWIFGFLSLGACLAGGCVAMVEDLRRLGRGQAGTVRFALVECFIRFPRFFFEGHTPLDGKEDGNSDFRTIVDFDHEFTAVSQHVGIDVRVQGVWARGCFDRLYCSHAWVAAVVTEQRLTRHWVDEAPCVSRRLAKGFHGMHAAFGRAGSPLSVESEWVSEPGAASQQANGFVL
jgi:hypothetical protein